MIRKASPHSKGQIKSMFFRSRTSFLDQALIAQSILAHTHLYFEMKQLFHVETKIYSFVCSSLFLRPFDLFVAKHNSIPDSTSICDKKCLFLSQWNKDYFILIYSLLRIPSIYLHWSSGTATWRCHWWVFEHN
jgi:hypothetical protein